MTSLPHDRRCCDSALDAVAKHHIDCIVEMSSAGDVHRLLTSDIYGENALHLAVREGDAEMIKLLMSHAPSLCEQRLLSGETASLLAAELGRQEILMELLSEEDACRPAILTDAKGNSVLMAAVVRDDNEMACYLLAKFGRLILTLPSRSLVQPAHIAAARGNMEFLKAVVVVDASAIHCRDEYGCTPAIYAVLGRHTAVLRLLIGLSKDCLHETNNKGMSLLHVACIAGEDDIVRYLLGKMGKAAITATTNDRANTVHCAAYAGHTHILAQLLGCLSKKKRKEVLSARDSCGSTALHLAAIGNYIDTALFLVEAGADPSLLNSQQQTAREVALIRGHGSLASVLSGAKVAKSKQRRSLAMPTRSLAHSWSTDSGSESSWYRPTNFRSCGMHIPPLPYPFDLHNHLRNRESGPSPDSSFSMNSLIHSSYSQSSSGYSSSGETSQVPRRYALSAFRRNFARVPRKKRRERSNQRLEARNEELPSIEPIDDVTWISEGLNAVEAIDRILDGMDGLEEDDDDEWEEGCASC